MYHVFTVSEGVGIEHRVRTVNAHDGYTAARNCQGDPHVLHVIIKRSSNGSCSINFDAVWKNNDPDVLFFASRDGQQWTTQSFGDFTDLVVDSLVHDSRP